MVLFSQKCFLRSVSLLSERGCHPDSGRPGLVGVQGCDVVCSRTRGATVSSEAQVSIRLLILLMFDKPNMIIWRELQIYLCLKKRVLI